ncbi:hypothetical protein [Faecalibacterium sp.]|uniref:hypothetical protein n=1 Tax=Faecalibacterium sp. TaxID=1971605 RepID=UPI0025BEF0D0|nr:hypothetical protein [Faecalibacterium sp.]
MDGMRELQKCRTGIGVCKNQTYSGISNGRLQSPRSVEQEKIKRRMAMLEDWTIYSWYCPNCKTQVAGLKNKKNQIRVICTKCGVEMVRTVVSRRHDVIDMYAPSEMEHSELELREY